MDALRGALRTLQQATVVTAEIQIFSERDTLVELLGFMQGLGFALYDISDLGYYPSDGTLYQCYATFIPRRMEFRHDIPWVPPGKEAAVLALLRERRENNLQAIDELISNT
jgi:hypothetical protein